MAHLDEILMQPRLNGVYRIAGPVADRPGLARLDARALAGKAALLGALGRALELPDYYGANWDALEECLNDLSWRAAGVFVLIEHAGLLGDATLDTLIGIWRDAAAQWAGEGRGFVLLLEGVARADLPRVS